MGSLSISSAMTLSLAPRRSGGGTPTPTPAPSFSVQPSIAGTPQVGVASVGTPGTASNTTGHTYRWLLATTSGGTYTAISGATSTSYTPVSGDETKYLKFEDTATGSGGSTVATSAFVGPVAAAVAISAPVLTQTSSAGASPILMSMYLANAAAGMYFRLMRTNANTAGVPNWADVSAQTEERIITLEDFNGSPQFSLVTGPPDGYNAFRLQIYDDGGNTSAWSNVIADTISAAVSTAVLATTDGVNKSQYIDVTGTPKLIATMNNHIGVPCSVRTLTAPTGKKHWEVTINSVAPGGLIEIGMSDSAVALGAAVFTGPHAGSGSTAGVALAFSGASTSIYANGSTTGGSTPTLAAADIIVIEFDTTANTATFEHKRGGTVTSLASVTLTSNIPTNWTAYVGGALNDSPGDGVTVNFGATTFAKTPTSGYSFYG